MGLNRPLVPGTTPVVRKEDVPVLVKRGLVGSMDGLAGLVLFD